MPKVSVIIPTYNRDKYIVQALESVFSQTFKDFEVIVVDDGSTDRTRDILRAYNGKIRYFFQENNGISSARNLGIAQAKGEYLAFLDSDDVWLNEKLEKQVAILDKNPTIGLVYTSGRVIGHDGSLTDAYRPVRPAIDLHDFLKGATVPMSVLVRKEPLGSIAPFDTDMKVAVDTDYWTRLSAITKLYFIKDALMFYRSHEGNTSNNPVEIYRGHIATARKLLNNKSLGGFRKLIKARLAKQYYLLAQEQGKRYRYKDALGSLVRAFRYSLLTGRLFIDHSDTFLKRFSKIISPYFLLLYYSLHLLSGWHPALREGQSKSILYYEASSGYGGSARSLSLLVNHLNQGSFRSFVAIKNFGYQFSRITRGQVIKLPSYNEPNTNSAIKLAVHFLWYSFPQALRLLAQILRNKINVIHTNTSITDAIPAILAARIANIPCVCHFRGTRRLLKREEVFLGSVDRVIVLNTKAKDCFLGKIDRQNVKVIFDGIDLSDFDVPEGKLRKEFSLGRGILIGLIGRINEGKGQKEFVHCAKRVVDVRPDAVFIIAGDAKGDSNSYFLEVKALVENLGLRKSVLFTGWRDDIATIIADMDIVVQGTTTFPEGFGLTIVEAMALRKPVIATRIPGPDEIVDDGRTGYLVAPGDIEMMSERILELIASPETRKSMGEEGRRRVEQNFEITKTTTRIESLYKELMRERGMAV